MLFWFGTWAYFFVRLIPKGVSYFHESRVAAFYFFAVSMMMMVLFPRFALQIFRNIKPGALGILLCVLALYLLIYYLAPSLMRVKREHSISMIHPAIPMFLTFDFHYLLVKSIEVFYQQIFVAFLALTLARLGLSIQGIVFIFAFLFSLIHLPLILSEGMSWGLYFAGAAFCASFIFPPLILFVPSGFVYSYLIHLGFYVGSGIFFGLYYHGRIPHRRLRK